MNRLRNFDRDGIFSPAVPGLSSDAARVDDRLIDVYRHWRETLTSEVASPEVLFSKLADRWRSDTEFDSSVTRIAMHPAYQRIIGMGRTALPFILRDLESTHGPWFWALQAITGENPVPPEDRGYIERMTRAWIAWGIRHEIG